MPAQGLNCFDYVVAFLNTVGVAGSGASWSKVSLCTTVLDAALHDAQRCVTRTPARFTRPALCLASHGAFMSC